MIFPSSIAVRSLKRKENPKRKEKMKKPRWADICLDLYGVCIGVDEMILLKTYLKCYFWGSDVPYMKRQKIKIIKKRAAPPL